MERSSKEVGYKALTFETVQDAENYLDSNS